MRPIRFLPEAQSEIDDAVMESNDPVRFRAEVRDAFELIRDGTVIPPSVRPANIRHYIYKRLPFSVIYRDDPNEILVVAFAPHKRRPGYWRDRIGT